MTPEIVAGLVTLVGGALTAWNTKQGRQIKELTVWRTVATRYIGDLLFTMATHGVKPPPPPEELGLVSTRSDEAGG